MTAAFVLRALLNPECDSDAWDAMSRYRDLILAAEDDLGGKPLVASCQGTVEEVQHGYPPAVVEAVAFLSRWAADASISDATKRGWEPYPDREALAIAIAGGIWVHMDDPDYETADRIALERKEGR